MEPEVLQHPLTHTWLSVSDSRWQCLLNFLFVFYCCHRGYSVIIAMATPPFWSLLIKGAWSGPDWSTEPKEVGERQQQKNKITAAATSATSATPFQQLIITSIITNTHFEKNGLHSIPLSAVSALCHTTLPRSNLRLWVQLSGDPWKSRLRLSEPAHRQESLWWRRQILWSGRLRVSEIWLASLVAVVEVLFAAFLQTRAK